MKFYSTQGKSPLASLKEAVFQGIASDGGLFLPVSFPKIPQKIFAKTANPHPLILFEELANAFFEEDLSKGTVQEIVHQAFNYPLNLTSLNPLFHCLELFHGPTLSFKDFGARFMAQLVKHLLKPDEKMLVLVATSGDTGSAVAQAFYKIPNVKVFILYSSGQVSDIQEKQLTTLGENVTAIEVKSSFDTCQNLVRLAFKDQELKNKYILTTANSINVARLIPQAFYFFYAYQLIANQKPLAVSVPCGNFGHLMSALLAKKAGLPIEHFIAATNINDEIPHFLDTGIFEPHPSKHTISNSMDVGNPSNFPRLWEFFHRELGEIRKEITGMHFNDEETAQAISEVYQQQGYVLDPHSAISYLGLKNFLKDHLGWQGLFLATAHPAKFPETVEKLIKRKVAVPQRLEEILQKKKSSIVLSDQYNDLKEILLGS